jgi:hypothetical protein
MKFDMTARAFGLLLLIAVFGNLSPQRALAQARPSSKANVISIDPLGLAVREPLNIQFEIKAGPVYSWAFRAHYWPGRVGGGALTGNWTAFGLGAVYRIFIADSRALTGLSVAPAADLLLFSQTIQGGQGATATVAWIGGDIAYKWIFDQFSIEPLLGLRIGYTPSVNAPGYATGPIAVLSVYGGYAW